jgi:DME family drug/metabolite transporter
MTHQRSLPAGRGILYVAIAAAVWGTGGAVAAVLFHTSGLGPVAVTFWRFAGGLLLLVATGLATGRARHRAGSSRWRVFATGIGLATSQAAYFAAVGYAGVALATLVTIGAGPVLIALGARVLLGERLRRLGLAATGLALVGLVLLAGGGTATAAPAPALGLACALVSAMGYAGVTLLHRRAGGGGPAATLGGFAVGMVCLLPLALLEGALPASDDLLRTVLLLGYLGAVPTALGYALFFAGLAVVRAATASVVVLLEPVVAAAIAAGLLGERLTLTALAGGGLLLGAVTMLAVWEGYRVSDSTDSASSTVNAPA